MQTSKIENDSGVGKIEKTSDNSWTVTLEEDPETGELIMPFPEGLLESQGWKIGDTLSWDIESDTHTFVLKKIE